MNEPKDHARRADIGTALALLAMLAPLGSASAAGVEAYGRLPLRFEKNEGQVDARVSYLSRGPGYTLFLTPDEAVFSLRSGRTMPASRPSRAIDATAPKTSVDVLRVKVKGASPTARVTAEDELPGRTSTFVGSDPKEWRTNVPGYGRVRYSEVYPGIDLVYHASEGGRLEYDFVVRPGADPRRISLRYEGARRLRLNAEGDLRVSLSGGDVVQRRPVVYQEKDGTRERVEGTFVVRGRDVAFRLAAYDASRPLVIDPVIAYSTYLGGSSSDEPHAVAVDALGNLYVAGQTFSTNFPTTPGALQTTDPDTHESVFVTKISATGGALVYSTYIGGAAQSTASGITVDAAGYAYIVGASRGGWPVTPGAFQNGHVGDVNNYNGVVAKLGPAGDALVYSTYLGESTSAAAVAVDASGVAHVVGTTSSPSFPTTASALQPAPGGGFDGFLTKLSASGTSLLYSTYLGGDESDFPEAVALDASGYIYVAGESVSSNFPTTAGAFQRTNAGGEDTFVVEVTPAGGLVFSTLVGGNGHDFTAGFALVGGNAIVAVDSLSSNFPTTAGVLQPSDPDANPARRDGVVYRLNSAGTALVFSTYLGASRDDVPIGLGAEPGGIIHVAGFTNSPDFPVTPGAFQPTYKGFTDLWYAVLNPTGTQLTYSTYLGGTSGEDLGAFVLDASGNAFIASRSSSPDYPTTPGAFQTALNGTSDAVVTRFAPAGPDLELLSSDTPDPATAGGNITYQLVAVNNGPGAATNVVITDTLPPEEVLVSATPSAGGQCTAPAAGATGIVSCVWPGATGTGFPNARTLTLVVKTCTDLLCGSIQNAAKVTSATADPAPGNDTVLPVTGIQSQSDLSVAMSHTPDPGAAGGQVTYTIVVTNAGPGREPLAMLTDTLPAGFTIVSATSTRGTCAGVGTGSLTCNLGALGVAGGCVPLASSATVTLVAAVPLLSSPGTYTNVASVVSSNCSADPTPANNSVSDPTEIRIIADLALEKTGPPGGLAAPGRDFDYSLKVTNNGPSRAFGAQVIDPLPFQVRSRQVRAPQGWTCTPAVSYPTPGGTVTCTYDGWLNPGTYTIGIRVTAPPVCQRTINLVNTAVATSPTTDPSASNNTSSVVTVVTGGPCFN